MPAGERLRVFLTNTLEEAHERTGALFAHEIVREAAGADDVKRKKAGDGRARQPAVFRAFRQQGRVDCGN